MLVLGLRIGKRPRCVVATTPKPSKLLRDLISREGKDVVITRSSSYANRTNLAPAFFEQIIRKYEWTRLGRQELNAELLDDVEGALWNRVMLDDLRVDPGQRPGMKRIVVAIDPAVSCGEDSDETGIIVSGLGEDGLGYVLEDASGRHQPAEWARKAMSLYKKWRAYRVLAEINQGGVLVEQTLRAVDGNVSFRGVHAKRGKIVRAEPIAALYEQKRVKHVGIFVELDDQLCTYACGGDSPDRLDALVYAMTELLCGAAETSRIFVGIDLYDRWDGHGDLTFVADDGYWPSGPNGSIVCDGSVWRSGRA